MFTRQTGCGIIYLMKHLAIILISGLLGVAVLVGSAVANPVESFAALPVWSYPVCVFMLLGGLFSDKES